MARILLVVLLGATIAIVSCSQPTNTKSAVDLRTSPLKTRIPPADQNKYDSAMDARLWQNPYLRVQANGIDVRSIRVPRQAPTMSPTDVIAYLEKLPSIAWPYGLVVAVQENGVRSRADDDASFRRNREELVRLLEKAGVKVEFRASG
jgi:hypothetical protein